MGTERLICASASASASCYTPEIVGKPESIAPQVSLLRAQYGPSNAVMQVALKGLHALDSDFMLEKITGDGHCLFRAIGTQFIRKLAAMQDEVFDIYLATLAQRVDDLKSIPLDERFAEVVEICLALKEGRLTAQDIVYTPKSYSDKIVAFLRLLACEQNHVHNEKYAKNIKGCHDISEIQYVVEMSNMQEPVWGSSFETQALAEALQMNIHVLDVERVARVGKVDGSNYYRAAGRKTLPDDMTLIFRVNHYDIAAPRN